MNYHSKIPMSLLFDVLNVLLLLTNFVKGKAISMEPEVAESSLKFIGVVEGRSYFVDASKTMVRLHLCCKFSKSNKTFIF